MLPSETRYMIYNDGGFNRGTYRTHCPLADATGDIDLAIWLADEGAAEGERWYARPLSDASPHAPMGLYFLDIKASSGLRVTIT